MATDCIFCKIAAQEIKTPLIHEDADLVAFRDLHPQAPKHLLVVPRKHVQDVRGTDDATLLGRMLQAATRVAENEGLAQGGGFRLVINTGPDAGQTVHHLHVHVLGGRVMGWPPG